MASFVCCAACKPRYKRLVDNIFPSSQEEGLVRSEMEKLTYYAVSAPEKLDRIGVYLAKLLVRHIQRKRDKYVFIAMEALNQLLLACHAQQINLFVESFLKMVATLLESPNPFFQALAVNSFESFSKIEEDAPSYHRRYDFFVSKFSSMCYSNMEDLEKRQKIQLYGVRGIRGVIRKTVSDELQVNIWEKQHMDKIIPSLLYTMQSNPNKSLYEDGTSVPVNDCEYPWILAEESLRELLSRAAFANVHAAISPALAHMDSHKLWAPVNFFAIKCFKIFMYSIQSQYTHVIVKMLLDHIDVHDSEDETIKANMVQVLCAVVPIPSCAIGPSVIDIFNRLSKHFKMLGRTQDQKKFETALIEATGILASVVPDYQKLEILSFYINKAQEALMGALNLEEAYKQSGRYSHLLLKCLIEISKTYKVSNNLSSLSSTLLDPLLKLALMTDPNDRLLAHRILISLLDKNCNYSKFNLISDHSDFDKAKFVSSVPGKQDTDFLNKRLPNIYHWLFESFMLEDNVAENFIVLHKCVVVLSLSLTNSEIIMELCRLTLAVQSATIDVFNYAASDSDNLRACWSMAATACNMIVLSQLSNIPQFQSYIKNVLHAREKDLPEFLPNILKNAKRLSLKVNSEELSEVTFSSTEIYNILSGHTEFNVDKLNQSFLENFPLDNVSVDAQRSAIDVESINIQLKEHDQSMVESDGKQPASNITYSYLKQIAMKPPITREEQLEINKKAADHILSAEFGQLIAEMKPDPTIKACQLLNQLLQEEDIAEEGVFNVDDYSIPPVF